MMIEFGLPNTYMDAILRIPNIHDSQYGIDKPITGCAKFRMHIEHVTTSDLYKDYNLLARSMKMTTEEISLLHQTNSFRRSNSPILTAQWARLENSKWATIFPLGDDNYRWWQISKFEPSEIDTEYTLYCVESNKIFETRKTYYRFNQHSFFVILMATHTEINSLINELSSNDTSN